MQAKLKKKKKKKNLKKQQQPQSITKNKTENISNIKTKTKTKQTKNKASFLEEIHPYAKSGGVLARANENKFKCQQSQHCKQWQKFVQK